MIGFFIAKKYISWYIVTKGERAVFFCTEDRELLKQKYKIALPSE